MDGRLVEPHADRKKRAFRHDAIGTPWWFVIPITAVYVFVVVYPSIAGGIYSFTDWNGIATSWKWVGFDNFRDVFHDASARSALLNTMLLALVVTIIQNALGLALALGLSARIRARSVLRVIFFAPVVMTPLVSGYVWNYLLAPNGVVNTSLRAIGLDALAHDWLGDPSTALGAIMAAIIWQFAGYSMVIFMAGLEGIPQEVIEASMIDGAGAWTRFTKVILPLLNTAIVTNTILSMVGGFKQFDQVMAMTGGGPGTATETISTQIYKSAFTYGEYPFSVALAVVMTVLVAVIAVIQFKFTNREAI